MATGTAIKEIGRDIAHNDTEENRLKGDANGSKKNFGIKKVIKKLGIIAKLEGRNIRAAWGTKPEAVNDDKADGDDQQ
ncbi:hypothetical protein JCM39068_01190 [Desulfocastanea catecholica]